MIQRYDLVEYGGYYRDHHMEHTSDGEWVRHDDVEATLRSATQALQAATERAEQAEKDRDCYLKNLEDAQGDIAAEVAENQRLRDSLRTYGHHYSSCGVFAHDLEGRRPSGKPCTCGLASLLTRPPKEETSAEQSKKLE